MNEVVTDKPVLETWNTCYSCHKSWKDEIPTPGLLHRTTLCKTCLFKDKKGKQ